MFWLFYPLYVTRLCFILDWLQRHDLVLVWHGRSHWFSLPTIERFSTLDFATKEDHDA